MELSTVENYVLSYITTLNSTTKYGDNLIDNLDILAICHIESGYNTLAYRFEPKLNEASYGIMQVLLSTAKDRGFNGIPEDLFSLATGLRYGIATLYFIRDYLTWHLNNPPTQQQIVEAYNEGIGNVVKGVLDESYYEKFIQVRNGFNDGCNTLQ